MPMSTRKPIGNRYEGIALLDCIMSNYNGDPDNGNLPRIDLLDEHGIIRDGAIKNAIRAGIALAGKRLLVSKSTDLNTRIAEAHVAASGALPPTTKEKKYSTTVEAAGKAADWICDTYSDARYFGAVLETGPNAGQITGPVQIAHSRSVCKVDVVHMGLTRCCDAAPAPKGDLSTLTVEDYQKNERETPANKLRSMGRTAVAKHALFPIRFFLSVKDAVRTGFSEEDFNLLLDCLLNLYEANRTGSKSDMSVYAPVVFFKHVGTPYGSQEDRAKEAAKGCYPAHELLRLIKILPKVETPCSIDDYDFTVAISRLPEGVEMGLARYARGKVEIDWVKSSKGVLPAWVPDNFKAI